jgi:LysR family transcriptional regulator, regulator for bpeEF and oprC
MLDDAEIFVSVAECKSFSKAARKLKLSAPIVTRHIAKLEKKLQTRLFQRNTRQVSLTESGALFYESCISLLNTYATAVNQLKSFKTEISGTLKIGLPSSLSQQFVTTHLAKFIKKYPAINIVIVNGNHLIDLLSSGFDLIIHCGKLINSDLYCRKLGSWTKVTAASPRYLKRFGTPKRPEDLRNHNCLDHYDNVNNTWNYLINDEIKAIQVNGNIRANSSLDLTNLAIDGLGIVYLPSFTVKDALRSGQLKSVLTDYQAQALEMYAVYPSQRFLSAKVKVFIEFLMGLGMAD